MKQIPPFAKIALYAIIFLLNFMLFNSCKKLDTFSKELSPQAIEAKFFAAKPDLPLPVLKVMDALKKQNALGGFIQGLVSRDGYAMWEKSQVRHVNKIPTYNFNGEENDVVEVFTPIVQQDSNFVNGFFFSKIVGDSVELHLYRANDYDLYPKGSVDSLIVTADKITLKILELDKILYGDRLYELLDDGIFSQIIKDSLSPTILSIKSTEEMAGKQVFLCVRMQRPANECTCIPQGGGCKDWQTCDDCGYWFCFTIGSPDPPSGGTVSWPPDPPISTGGGGNTPPTTGNCTPTTNCGQLRSLIIEGREPCGGCGPGPVIVVPPDDPPVNFPPLPNFIWTFSGDDNSTFTDLNPNEQPDFILDPLDNYETNYPKFTLLVKNLKSFVKDNTKVMAALQRWSGFTKQQIVDHLTFGQGPAIKLRSSHPTRGTNFYGWYNKQANPSVININSAYVNLLELIPTERYKEGVAFLLAVTLLHEYVHYGTAHNNISEGGYDFGTLFEQEIFNVVVENTNALDLVINFQKYF